MQRGQAWGYSCGDWTGAERSGAYSTFMGQGPSVTEPQFWSSAVIAKALACCDLPVLLEEVRKARGWTQAELAATIGYSQSWVSKVLRGRQALTLQRAVIMLEVATAARQEGAAARDTDRIDEAFALASQALASGQRYASERVIERSRQFRRAYSGPVTGQMREFDHQLQATLA